jgi:hypothetical protein
MLISKIFMRMDRASTPICTPQFYGMISHDIALQGTTAVCTVIRVVLQYSRDSMRAVRSPDSSFADTTNSRPMALHMTPGPGSAKSFNKFNRGTPPANLSFFRQRWWLKQFGSRLLR